MGEPAYFHSVAQKADSTSQKRRTNDLAMLKTGWGGVIWLIPPLTQAAPFAILNAMTEQASVKTITRLSRRAFLAATAAARVGVLTIAKNTPARAAIVQADFSKLPPYGNGTIPKGVRSRQIANVNGMTVHILEAGYETPERPMILLLHGFPELAYSWRKVMPSLAAAGYHVIAPDQRGYGRTIGWDDSYDAVSHSQHDARRHRTDLRAGPPLGGNGGRA
jgi:hypothetical protein